MSVLRQRTDELQHALEHITQLDEPLRAAAAAIAGAIGDGGKLLAAGNGGSAAEAQHLSSELIGRLNPSRDRRGLPGLALHADTSTLTALGNDFGYDEVFARQVEALGRAGDILVVLSTSGKSPNLVRAVDAANALNMVTIGLLGRSEQALHTRCHHVLAVPSDSLQAIQECHLLLVHALVEQVEDLLPGATG